MLCDAPVIQKVDNTIHWINIYSVASAIGLPYAYRRNSDLSDALTTGVTAIVKPRPHLGKRNKT